MGRGVLAAAWLVSVLPALGSAWGFAPVSATAWALLPWIALAGAPGLGPRKREHRTAPVVTCALALPGLALAVALEHAAGTPLAVPLATAATGTLIVLLLALAAERAEHRPLAHGLTWFALVPGTALGAWALGLGGTRSAVLESVAAASPLAWCLERAAHAAVPGSVPLGALAVAAVCLATTARRRS